MKARYYGSRLVEKLEEQPRWYLDFYALTYSQRVEVASEYYDVDITARTRLEDDGCPNAGANQ